MYAAYLFSVVAGGGLLLLSLLGDLLGSDAVEIELEGDLDIGIDDLDLDFDADSDVDHSASKILSIRTLTYAMFGFGAVGWVLSYLGFAPAAPLTITYAGVGGLASGALVNQAFAYLRRTETGMLEEDSSFVGLAGDVTLRLGGGSTGNVAIERGGRRHTLRALPHASVDAGVPPKDWKSVVVVEMKDGVAHVAPTEQDLKALPR
jgi:hypothetical protein